MTLLRVPFLVSSAIAAMALLHAGESKAEIVEALTKICECQCHPRDGTSTPFVPKGEFTNGSCRAKCGAGKFFSCEPIVKACEVAQNKCIRKNRCNSEPVAGTGGNDKRGLGARGYCINSCVQQNPCE